MQKTNFSNHESIRCAYPIVKETIPQSSLGYTTNNKYPEFPPLMSDGRSITATWQHDAVINAKLVEDNKIQSNWEYRKYLTNNAFDVMQNNFREASNDMGYISRHMTPLSIQSNLVNNMLTPKTYETVHDNTKYLGHTTSDLKTTYLTREQLNSRKVSPVITQESFIRLTAEMNKTSK